MLWMRACATDPPPPALCSCWTSCSMGARCLSGGADDLANALPLSNVPLCIRSVATLSRGLTRRT